MSSAFNIPEHADVIIVGSGLAGLQCGVILSRHGYRVVVVEKGARVGGTLQSFSYKGTTYSTGLHYLGSLDKGQILHRLFQYFNLFDGILYQRMDASGFDVFEIGGKQYKFPMGWKAFRNYMKSCFPHEKEAIDQYVEAVEMVLEEQELFMLKAPSVSTKPEKPSQSVNAWDFICSLTSNKELRQVLSALNFVYAGEKEVTPWYVHALINHYFISSSYRIVGRSDQIPEKLTAEIIKNGGQVLVKHEVDQLLFDDHHITEICCTNGVRLQADHIISNVHPATTIQLCEPGKVRKSFINRLRQKTDTLSSFALYLKLKPGKFPYRNANFNYYGSGEVWYASHYDAAKWPEHFFMHFPVNENNAKWVDHLSVVTHMRFEEVAQWKDLPTTKRGHDYERFKEEKSKKLLALVLQQFPEMEPLIEDYTSATPLTFRDYVGSPTGSMYGTLRDYRSPLTSFVGARTKVPNLYFTGQNLNLHGLMGVSISALITCAEFVDLQELLNEINDQKSQPQE